MAPTCRNLFEFVTKDAVFDYLTAVEETPTDIGWLHIQRAGLASFAQGIEMSRVGEVFSAGTPFVHRIVRDSNELFVVELLDNGGVRVSTLDPDAAGGVGLVDPGRVVNILVSCGQFDSLNNKDLGARLDHMGQAVAPRGIMVHAMPFYYEDEPSRYWIDRINFLREYADSGQWELLTEETDFDLRFSSRLATLSDAAMFRLYQSSSVMKNLRKSAQGVVLMCAYRRAA